MTIPGPGPGDHRVAVKRGVTNTREAIGDRVGLVTRNSGALIGLGVSWRAQPIEKLTHKIKKVWRPEDERARRFLEQKRLRQTLLTHTCTKLFFC